MNIILIGMKGSGKTTVGKTLGKMLNRQFIDLDTVIEEIHTEEQGEKKSFRDIYKHHGKEYFQTLESKSLKHILETQDTEYILSCGGGTPMKKENQKLLKQMGEIIYLKGDKDLLLRRTLAKGIPAYFPYKDDPKRSFDEIVEERESEYMKIADVTIECKLFPPKRIAEMIVEKL